MIAVLLGMNIYQFVLHNAFLLKQSCANTALLHVLDLLGCFYSDF